MVVVYLTAVVAAVVCGWFLFFRQRPSLDRVRQKYRGVEWCAVVGCNDVGREVARVLSAAGKKLVLVGAGVWDEHGMEVQHYDSYKGLESCTAPVGLVVYVDVLGVSGLLTETSDAVVSRFLRHSVEGYTGVLLSFTKKWAASGTKGTFLTLNGPFSSIPAPLLSLNSAENAYVQALTTSLAAEVAPLGISICTLNTAAQPSALQATTNLSYLPYFLQAPSRGTALSLLTLSDPLTMHTAPVALLSALARLVGPSAVSLLVKHLTPLTADCARLTALRCNIRK